MRALDGGFLSPVRVLAEVVLHTRAGSSAATSANEAMPAQCVGFLRSVPNGSNAIFASALVRRVQCATLTA